MSIADCAAITEKGDPDRFLATMTAPVPARAALFPLYAFNVEVTRAPWVSAEPMICEMRLQWWHDVLGEIAAGAPLRAHEVAIPLTELLRDRGLPVEPLQALVAARRWDIYRAPFETTGQFDAYIEATSAGLMWLAAQALGAPEECEAAIRAVGWAGGLAGFLRAVPELRARGRQPLVDAEPAAIGALAQDGLERLARARRAGLPANLTPALRAAWRAEPTLRRAATAPERVLAGELEESGVARRLRLLRISVTGSW
ncbi:squalene/phytoene synthase family protein [Tropicimonas sp. IMCC6043]|uniref:phytoene/squalene synthase family protein n=1 Tax=Tropicimonas sp. IMCC6043 TaxID=2510645 RepID=UPI00101D53AA|nr:squalene/phytoene synthase family protein [Tropicimonas sp. IMCC6043]RYH10391.1 phytoene synthase [Tropicimonas sp. IMCC6043]